MTFQVRTFGTTDGEELWSFGDGFAATPHAFQKPGEYIVRVERANRLGHKAIAHLVVRVAGKKAAEAPKK